MTTKYRERKHRHQDQVIQEQKQGPDLEFSLEQKKTNLEKRGKTYTCIAPSRGFLELTGRHKMLRLPHLSVSAFLRSSRGHLAKRSVAAGASARWELVHDSLNTTSTICAKGMSDERQSWPILSANKIVQQKSVVCRAKIGQICLPLKSIRFYCPTRICSILDEKIAQLIYAATCRNKLTS